VQVTSSAKPNQATDYPILASPPTSINIYTDVIPKKQQQHQQQQQQQQQQHQLLRKMSSSMLNNGIPYNNMYGLMSPPASPLIFSQPNYFSVLAAAQSIANMASNYNNMAFPSYNNMHQQLMSPVPVYGHSQFQQNFQQQQPPLQQQQPPQTQQQQPANQIKRKPVQVQKTSTQSNTKIEQRIQRKKSSYQLLRQQQQQHQQPVQVKKEINKQQPNTTTQQQQALKKKVSFNDTLEIHNYHEEPLDEIENKQPVNYYRDDMGVDYAQHQMYTYPNQRILPKIRKYSSNNKLFDSHQQHYRPAYYHPTPEEVEEEEDYGNEWGRPAFL
jgi:hypothetical protein